MSLSITPNTDGTITISCGEESVTYGSPQPLVPQPPPAQPGPIFWPNDGNVAWMVARASVKAEVVEVPSADDLPRMLRETHDRHSHAPEPTTFLFEVRGVAPLKVADLNRALEDLGKPEWMGIWIRFTGPSDG